jgi:hypothetical protein
MPTPPVGPSGQPAFFTPHENSGDQVTPLPRRAKRVAPATGFGELGTQGLPQPRRTAAEAQLSTGRAMPPVVLPPLNLENLEAQDARKPTPAPLDTPKTRQLLTALRGKPDFAKRHHALAKKYSGTELKTWGKKRLSQLIADAITHGNKADEIQSPSMNQLITSPFALAEVRTSKALRWMINNGKFMLIPSLPQLNARPTTKYKTVNIESDMRNGLLIADLYMSGLIDASQSNKLTKGEEIKLKHFDGDHPTGINSKHTVMIDSISLLERDDIALVDRLCGFEKIHTKESSNHSPDNSSDDNSSVDNSKRGEIIQAGHLYRLTFGSHDEESIRNGKNLLDNELSFLKANIPGDEILSLGSLCMYAAKAGKIKETTEALIFIGIITTGVSKFLLDHVDQLTKLHSLLKPERQAPSDDSVSADGAENSASSAHHSSTSQSGEVDDDDEGDVPSSSGAPSHSQSLEDDDEDDQSDSLASYRAGPTQPTTRPELSNRQRSMFEQVMVIEPPQDLTTTTHVDAQQGNGSLRSPSRQLHDELANLQAEHSVIEQQPARDSTQAEQAAYLAVIGQREELIKAVLNANAVPQFADPAAAAPQVAFSSDAMQQEELINAALNLEVAQLNAVGGAQQSTRPPASDWERSDIEPQWGLEQTGPAALDPTAFHPNPVLQPAGTGPGDDDMQAMPSREAELLEAMEAFAKQ